MAKELRQGQVYQLPDGKRVIALRVEQPHGDPIWNLDEIEEQGHWELLPNGHIVEHSRWTYGFPIERSMSWARLTGWNLQDLQALSVEPVGLAAGM
ncbi:MAG: hypothetical protein HYY20_04620 [Candidatus Tectomicrobia bacterium]|uniref:Uncharacterized protein n=1 Tax=Tectimicrobiota bacterium TaxID=2528274 RepID=A0A932CN36_UNCTE|nr:hypothetical protein [Candidatus Tectomicrobia bacterium]